MKKSEIIDWLKKYNISIYESIKKEILKNIIIETQYLEVSQWIDYSKEEDEDVYQIYDWMMPNPNKRKDKTKINLILNEKKITFNIDNDDNHISFNEAGKEDKVRNLMKEIDSISLKEEFKKEIKNSKVEKRIKI